MEDPLASLRSVKNIFLVLTLSLEELDVRVVQDGRDLLKVANHGVNFDASCKQMMDNPPALLTSGLRDKIGGHVQNVIEKGEDQVRGIRTYMIVLR